jgi:hypothetical protein
VHRREGPGRRVPDAQPRCLRGLGPPRRCPTSRSSWGCSSTHVAVRRSW